MRERDWDEPEEEQNLSTRIKPTTVYLGRKGHPNPCAVETTVLGRRKPRPEPPLRLDLDVERPAPEQRPIRVPRPVSKGQRITRATAKTLGARGGSRRSARKTAAARRNARRPRPRRSRAGK